MWQWLQTQWQDVKGNFKFWLISIIGGAVVIAAVAITRGLLWWQQLVLVALFVLLFGWAVIASYLATRPLPAPTAGITPENIEPNIRDWIDAFGWKSQKLPEPTTHFAFEVTLPIGVPVAIVRTKDRDRYLTLVARIDISPKYKALFEKLPESERHRFIQEIRIEAARSKINCALAAPFDSLNIDRLIPITDGLTEASLIQDVREMSFAVILLRDTIIAGLERRQEIKPPSSTPDTAASPP